MKNNYFSFWRKSVFGFGLVAVAALGSAFIPKPGIATVNPENPPTFFDPGMYTQFTITGLSDDVIANGLGSLMSTTTNDVDGADYCYLAVGTQITSSDTPITYGLPIDGVLTSPDITDLTYQLADYDSNNSLRIADDGAAGEATITFAEIGNYSAVYLAVTSGSGSSTISGTLNFQDGTTQAFSGVSISDWYGGSNAIIQGIGRGNMTDDGLDSNSSNPRIYQVAMTVDAGNQGKLLTGITVQKTGGVFNLFAASGALVNTCAMPTAVAVSGVPTTSAADITWTGSGTPGETYEYTYVLQGEAMPASGTVASTTMANLTGLAASTTYDFYVRTNCGGGAYSFWEGPFTFATDCDVVAGIDEDFEGDDIPLCWTIINGGDTNTWFLHNSTTYAHSGSKSMRISYDSNTAHDDYLITPKFTVTEHVSDIISFWARNYSSTYVEEFDVLVSTTGNTATDFTDVLATAVAPPTSYTLYTYDLSAYIGQDIYFAVKATSQDEYYLNVDDFMTSGTPFCDVPENVTADNITVDNVDFNWDDTGAASYDYYIGYADDPEPTTPTGNVTTNTVSIPGLDFDTEYAFYVRSNCGGTDGVSEWAMIELDTPIACPEMTDIVITYISTTEVTITWANGGTEAEWEVVNALEDDPEPVSGTLVNSNTYNINTLVAGTEYKFYVRAYCGTTYGYSEWEDLEYTTLCDPVVSIDESFEDEDDYDMAECWSVINGGGSNEWEIYSSSTYAHSGAKAARIVYNTTAHNDYLITPGFIVTDHVNDIFSFWVIKTSTWGDDQIDVLLSTTGVQEADFTETLASSVDLSTSYQQLEYNLSAYEGQTVYVAIKAISTNEYTVYVDDVLTSGEPLCNVPENGAGAAVSTNEIAYMWDTTGANSYDYYFATVDTDVPDGASTPTGNTASLSVNIASLMANTTYYFYVRSNCGGSDGVSEWSDVITVTTPCDAVAGIDEDFEGDNVPDCWTIINGGDSNTWFLYNSTTYAHSGSKSMRISYDSNTAHDDYLITPKFTVTEHVSDIISFWAINYSSTYMEEFDVLVSTTGNTTADFTDVLATAVTPPTSYAQYTYDLSAYLGQDIYFAVKATSQDEYYLNVDDFLTSGSLYCDAPMSLTADVTPTSATLSWTDDLSTDWEVAIQTVGAGEPASGTAVTATSVSEAMTFGEVKEFYVRSVCSGGGFSPWAGPYVFGGATSLVVTSGYSDDVIANGVGDAINSTTNAVDEVNFSYLSSDFKPTASDADLSYGLPVDGLIPSSYVSGLNYKLADYDANNSLRIETVGNSGSLVFSNGFKAQKLFLLVVSGSGNGMLSGTIHFADGTTQAITSTYTPDWFNETSLPVAISGIGRVNRTNNNLENPSGNPRIYEMEIAIDAANEDRVIASVDLAKDSGGIINIFAASIEFSSAAFATDGVTANTITVYPNPVKNNLYIKGVEATSVVVYNMLGQQVNSSLVNNTVNMSGLQRGVYLVTVNSENGSQTIRVVKE